MLAKWAAIDREGVIAMKILAVACVAVSLLAPSAVFAAGTMSNINQDISLQGAEVTSNGASSGGSVSAFHDIVKFEKDPGTITIGKIANDGGKMESVSQKINADKAKITSNGAGITIGEITNK